MKVWKGLCALVLAAALLTGGALAAGRAALTDMSQVRQREAVSLMADLGIIKGKSDGSFAPRESVDRATMAKMIFGILMGDTNPAHFVSAGAELTDIGDSWARGEIGYCYSVGIIAGDGKGSFFPTGTVTVAGAAKMLLVTLGYDAKTQGYEGDSLWTDNILRDAEEVGLLAGIDQLNFESITRENAAQMLYNALFAQTREAIYGFQDGYRAITGYKVRPTTLGLETLGLVKCILTVGDVAGATGDPQVLVSGTLPQTEQVRGGGVALNPVRDGQFTLGAELAAGNVAVYVKAGYTVNEDKDGIVALSFTNLISTDVYPTEIAVLGSSAKGVPISTTQGESLTDKREGNTAFLAPADESPALRYFRNGLPVTAEEANRTAALRGVVVELLDADGDGKADMARLTVKSVNDVTGPVEQRVLADRTEIKIPGLPGLYDWKDAAQVSGWQTLEVGDVVLTATVGNTLRIDKAEMGNGTVTQAVGAGEELALHIDGTDYKASQLLPSVIEGWDSFDTTCYFWVDDGGAIVRIEKISS